MTQPNPTGPLAAAPGSIWSEWRSGWGLVLVGAIGTAVLTTRYYSIGLFMQPMNAELGWSRGQVSSVLMIYSFVSVFISPLVGWLALRHGARPVALVGITGSAVVFAALSQVTPNIWTWYIGYFVFALFVDAGGPLVWTTGIASRFEKHRGLAFAVAMSMSGVVSAIMPAIVLALLLEYDWRTVWLGVVAGGFLLLFPATLFLFKPAHTAKSAAGKPGHISLPGRTVREALTDWRFWLIGPSMLAVAAAAGTAMVHSLPIFMDAGLSPGHAAAAMAMIGPGVVIGRLGGGVLLDRLPGHWVACATCLLAAISCAMFLNVGTFPYLAALAALSMGIAAGAEGDVIAYLVSRYFGLKSYPAVFGLLFGFFTMGTGTSPAVAGFIFDATGSYNALLGPLTIALVVVALAVTRLGRYPDFDKAP